MALSYVFRHSMPKHSVQVPICLHRRSKREVLDGSVFERMGRPVSPLRLRVPSLSDVMRIAIVAMSVLVLGFSVLLAFAVNWPNGKTIDVCTSTFAMGASYSSRTDLLCIFTVSLESALRTIDR